MDKPKNKPKQAGIESEQKLPTTDYSFELQTNQKTKGQSDMGRKDSNHASEARNAKTMARDETIGMPKAKK